jgi:hypothetical protein
LYIQNGLLFFINLTSLVMPGIKCTNVITIPGGGKEGDIPGGIPLLPSSRWLNFSRPFLAQFNTTIYKYWSGEKFGGSSPGGQLPL